MQRIQALVRKHAKWEEEVVRRLMAKLSQAKLSRAKRTFFCSMGFFHRCELITHTIRSTVHVLNAHPIHPIHLIHSSIHPSIYRITVIRLERYLYQSHLCFGTQNHFIDTCPLILSLFQFELPTPPLYFYFFDYLLFVFLLVFFPNNLWRARL